MDKGRGEFDGLNDGAVHILGGEMGELERAGQKNGAKRLDWRIEDDLGALLHTQAIGRGAAGDVVLNESKA